jgi:hypothetical protein
VFLRFVLLARFVVLLLLQTVAGLARAQADCTSRVSEVLPEVWRHPLRCAAQVGLYYWSAAPGRYVCRLSIGEAHVTRKVFREIAVGSQHECLR